MSVAAPCAEATRGALLREATLRLDAAGIDNAALDARVLLIHALGLSREDLARARDAAVAPAERARFADLVARRAAREPIARLTGQREFWSLPFAISPATLIPRPDSETVVEAALAEAATRDARLSVLDLGTGSGCLLLALLSELPGARGIGVDRSEPALRTARANARALGLAHRAAFLCADWDAALDGRFHVILSNPPYIPITDIPNLDHEVARHEPRAALDGGADGLDAYRALAPALARLLAPGGTAAIEIGATQDADVGALLARHGLAVRRIARDLAGRPRCVVAARV